MDFLKTPVFGQSTRTALELPKIDPQQKYDPKQSLSVIDTSLLMLHSSPTASEPILSI